MRLRELLQLIGLGKGIRFYPTRLKKIEINSTESWFYPMWLTPKPPETPEMLSEISLYSQILDKGDWAIDVGAHLGDSTVPLAVACGLRGGVLAFEPNPATFHLLSINSCLNRNVGIIIPIPLAADDHYSKTSVCGVKQEIFEYGDHWLGNGGDHSGLSKWIHGSAYKVPVMSVSIPTFVANFYPDIEPKLKFIKIDCEGRDLLLLPDLVNKFAKQHCSFQWEMVNNQQSWDRVSHIFKGSCYKFWIRSLHHGFDSSAHKIFPDDVINVMAITASKSVQNAKMWTEKVISK